jgi:hypothetical protein
MAHANLPPKEEAWSLLETFYEHAVGNVNQLLYSSLTLDSTDLRVSPPSTILDRP